MAKRKTTKGKKRTSVARTSKPEVSETRAKKASSEKMSKRTTIIVIASVAVVVLVFLIVLLSSEDNRGDTSSTGGGSRSSVTVQSGALVNGEIQIDSYFLPQPGFITVHLALPDGAPGVIVGRSQLLTGQGSDVSIRVGGNQAGKNVVIGVYFDNGDGRFAVSTDRFDSLFTRTIALS